MVLQQVTAKEVTKKLMNQEALVMLDIRSEEAFNDWKIEGEHFEYVNIPYAELKDGVEELIEKLATDKEIVVICAKGISSKIIAEKLTERGFNVAYLLDGMNGWSEHLEPIKVGDLTDGGELYQFVRIGKGCLSYVVISEGEAAVIDPVRFTDVYIDFIGEKGATITQVLDTHLHADHISGGRKIAEETGATYWLPPKDATDVSFDYKPLEDGDTIKLGNTAIDIQALYSPGHTIGSTSFIIEEQFLLTGDILFIDSIGRPDLAGKTDAWVDDLRETLYTRYQELSNELIVLPAHYMSIRELNDDGSVAAKLGVLYETNHGLNISDASEFKKAVTENLPAQPNSHADIRQINMGKQTPNQEAQREMEIGPNRCAIR